MFLRYTIQKNKYGKRYKYYKLVESVWNKEKKQSRQEVKYYVGKLGKKEVKKIKMMLEIWNAQRDDLILTSVQDIRYDNSYQYLAIAVIFYFWDYWNFSPFFSSLPQDADREVFISSVIKILVANRCLNSFANQNIPDWVKQTAIPFIEEIESSKINETRIHRELDFLYKYRKELKKYIRESVLQKNPKTIYQLYYDFSYIVFEGKGTDLAAYNKGIGSHIIKKKLLLSLLVTEEGYPLSWEVLKGNSAGITTFKDKVKQVKKYFPLSNVTLIFDRGMVSHDNLDLPFFKKNKYITGLKKNQIRNIIGDKQLNRFKAFSSKMANIEDITGFDEFAQDIYLEDTCIIDKRRYVLGFNKKKFKEDRLSREERIERFEKEIEELNIELRKVKKNKDKDILTADVYNLAKERRLRSYYKIKIKSLLLNDGKVQSYYIELKKKSKKIEKISLTDGLFMLVTNLKEKGVDKNFKYTKEDLLILYRMKDRVEKAFQNIKSFVKIEPVRHKMEHKIISHVDVCLISYLINITIYNKLKEDEKMHFGWNESIYRELAKCKIGVVRYNTKNGLKYNLNELTKLQEKILKQLNCEHLVERGYLEKMNIKKWIT